MRNRRIAAREHFAHDAVAIVHVGMAVLHPFVRREARMHPDGAANARIRIEREEAVSLPVVMDIVVDKHLPLMEVLLPIAEFHVEATVERLEIHLGVETLAGRHRPAPRLEYQFVCHDFSRWLAGSLLFSALWMVVLFTII